MAEYGKEKSEFYLFLNVGTTLMIDGKVMAEGIQALSLVDQDLKKAFNVLGAPSPRISPAGFETFLSTIVSQQLSTKVAKVIMQRVSVLMENITPAALISIADQDLRDAGLSWRKIEYAKGLADTIVNGHFNIDALNDLSYEEAIKSITRLEGFGPWSAEIYLMFSLQWQDVFPADDLAIVVALGELKGLEKKQQLSKHVK